VSFQFIGFAVTYMLHTSHATKYGSRTGLGITLIQTGIYMREGDDEGDINGNQLWGGNPPIGAQNTTGSAISDPSLNASFSPSAQSMNTFYSTYFSFALMTIGWFLVVSSLLGYARIKRIERALRNPPAPQAPPTPEELEREARLRATLEAAFGVGIIPDREPSAPQPETPSAQDDHRRQGEWV